MSASRRTGKFLSCAFLIVMLSLAVVLLLGKVPVGIEYGSPYRGIPDAATNGIDIVSAARSQIGVTVVYDPSYQNISYPNGDVPMERGVCSDVIVRALRTARGIDLQRLVHEDMKAHFIMYPSLIRWRMLGPDSNIDHRRVLNLERFFGRSGWSLEVTKEKVCYFPGDIVTCLIGGEIPHVMIVSDRKSPDGVPLVIHNVGSGTQEEDRLFSYEITGHHRLISCVATNDVSVLDMTSNVWGTSSREYRAAVFSALSEMRQQGACGDTMCGWFTNMVAYACPDATFEAWTGEKRFMIGTGASIPEIASSAECWLSVANYYGTLKGLRESLSEDTTRAARFAFLTNEDYAAYYAALADEKGRCGKCRAVEYAIPGISNIVLSSFPSVILPRLTDVERQEMVSNVTERAGLTEAEASLLEVYCGDIGNSGSN